MDHLNQLGYPTLGEVVRFVFGALGVLPEKRDPTPLTDKQRQALRRAINRLACEDGELEERFHELGSDLFELISAHISFPPLHEAMFDIADEMLGAYKSGLTSEGTFLGKKDTVRWLVHDRFAIALGVSVARSITRHGLLGIHNLLALPDEWYLPTVTTSKVTWPLEKVLRALYAHAGISQTEFHYPGRAADEANADQQRNLENAQNWTSDRSLPSAAALRWNIQQAFDARPSDKPGHFNFAKLDTSLHYEVIQAALLVARCTTDVCKAISDGFGAQFLTAVCTRFNQAFNWALAETQQVEEQIRVEAYHYGCSPLDPELRDDIVQRWNNSLSNRTVAAGKALNNFAEVPGPDSDATKQLIQEFGELAVRPSLLVAHQPPIHEAPLNFAQSLGEGLELWKSSDLREEQIDAYEERLKARSSDQFLPWITHWLRFLLSYRRDDDAAAWRHIALAYEHAKYRAGSNQYKIVNHYIEMAAKVQDRVAFRKGVNWARYLGISVRWIRDNDPSQENPDFAMAMLRKARYGV